MESHGVTNEMVVRMLPAIPSENQGQQPPALYVSYMASTLGHSEACAITSGGTNNLYEQFIAFCSFSLLPMGGKYLFIGHKY